MYRLVHSLTPLDRLRLGAHFVALDDTDRRLRFGGALPDDMLLDYVQGIDFSRDRVFAAFDSAFAVVAVAHLGIREGTAEIGLSVLPAHRREGLALRLVERCQRSAIAQGCESLWVHFLSENQAMTRLTHKLGMRVTASQGEADARLTLPQVSALALGIDLYANQMDAMLGVLRHWTVRAA